MNKETLEESANNFAKLLSNNHKTILALEENAFIEGAKWQAERMYSEEEVIAIVEKSRETGLTAEFLLLTEQFKKK